MSDLTLSTTNDEENSRLGDSNPTADQVDLIGATASEVNAEAGTTDPGDPLSTVEQQGETSETSSSDGRFPLGSDVDAGAEPPEDSSAFEARFKPRGKPVRPVVGGGGGGKPHRPPTKPR